MKLKTFYLLATPMHLNRMRWVPLYEVNKAARHSSITLWAKFVKNMRCLKCFPIVIKGWAVTFTNSMHCLFWHEMVHSDPHPSLSGHQHHLFFVMRPRWYGWLFNATAPIIHLSLEQWSGRIAWTPSLTHVWLKLGMPVFPPGIAWEGGMHQTNRDGGLLLDLERLSRKVRIMFQCIHQQTCAPKQTVMSIR